MTTTKTSFHPNLSSSSKTAIYKQLVNQLEYSIRNGTLKAGTRLPSMNELADQAGISKETVKKAYGILGEKQLIAPQQGKGFFVADIHNGSRPKVLVIFDKLSIYKQLLYNSLAGSLGQDAELTIVTHNQSLDLFEYYLDTYSGNYDYYVITPHFPLDADSQKRAVKLISRIPNRQLIMLDRLLPGYSGKFGAVYQDFEDDIYQGLSQGLPGVRRGVDVRLRVITLPESLYGETIQKGIERFCTDFAIPLSFTSSVPDDICKGDVFLLLNSQLDDGIVRLSRRIAGSGLTIGSEVRIISYNEFDINELVLGGLTTVSTDFREMGRLAAEMILTHDLRKVHCPFRMTRRRTF